MPVRPFVDLMLIVNGPLVVDVTGMAEAVAVQGKGIVRIDAFIFSRVHRPVLIILI